MDRPFFILLTTVVGLIQGFMIAVIALYLDPKFAAPAVVFIGGIGSALVAYLISETPKNGSPTTTSGATTTTNLCERHV